MSQYIVDFKDAVSQSEIDQYLSDNNATVIKTFNAFKNAYVIESSNEPSPSDLVEHIIHDDQHPVQLLGEVIAIDNNALYRRDVSSHKTQISSSDQNQWWKLYSLSLLSEMLDKPTIDLPIQGKGATIYLVDSGIKHDHLEFQEADISDLFSITSDYEDRKGHGTALASVMVGKTCGISCAKIKNVKLFDPQVSTKQSDMLAAFDAIFNDYATNTTKLGIVNCSWAIARNSYIESKIQILIDEGIFVVCSAGNNGTVIENVTPAAMKDTIVLGAYDSDFKPCDFSNYTDASTISVTLGQTNGGQLSGWAPGQNIWAANLTGGYGNASGTSLSAAIHSAILACELSEYIIDGEYSNGVVTSKSDTTKCFGKKGILDLSDTQYASSPNLVTNYTPNFGGDQYWKDLPERLENKLVNPDTNKNVILDSNRFFSFYILNPAKTKKAEIKSELPAGIVLNARGELRGAATLFSESNYLIKDSIIDITNLDDVVTTVNIKFIIKPNNPTVFPTTGDPVLDYQLQEAVDCPLGGATLAKGTTCYIDPFGACYLTYTTINCGWGGTGNCECTSADCITEYGKTSSYCICYQIGPFPC